MTHFLNEFLEHEIEYEMDWSEHFYSLKRGARGYKAIYSGPQSSRLYAYPDTGRHCHLEIPGELLEEVGSEQALRYLASLQSEEFEWRASRIDVAFDHVPFTPLLCREAWLSGRKRARTHQKSWKWYENDDGSTFNIGSRKSERFIRIYDRRGPTRLEIEFKGKWAEGVGKLLANSDPRQWIADCVGLVREYVDFLSEPYVAGSKKEAVLALWWSEFVVGIDRFRVPVVRPISEISKAKAQRTLERLTPSLYVIKEGLGISLDEIVEKGKWRLSLKHEQQIRKIRA